MQIFIDPNIDLRSLILHEQEYNDVQQCLSTGWENKKSMNFFHVFAWYYSLHKTFRPKGLGWRFYAFA